LTEGVKFTNIERLDNLELNKYHHHILSSFHSCPAITTTMVYFLPIFLSVFPVLALAQRRLDMSNPYASGQVMSSILSAKERTWEKYTSLGYFSPGRWKSKNAFFPCDNVTRKASVSGLQYRCKNLDITGHLSHTDLGTTYTQNIGK
jgi:hypothetical protein